MYATLDPRIVHMVATYISIDYPVDKMGGAEVPGRPTSKGASRRLWRWGCLSVPASVLILAVAFVALFPGQRAGLALTLGLGVGRDRLQSRIDGLEEKAISGARMSDADRAFLADFYRTLATGAKVSLFARQTGRMMDHYLDGSGEDFRLDSKIFSGNDRVRAQMSILSRKVLRDDCRLTAHLVSPVFYMPHRSNLDSVFGLYNGTVRVTRAEKQGARCIVHWRAEVPWHWPSYDSLRRKYGTPRAERFPLPNLSCLVRGPRGALHVGNGLGQYIAEVGLAKPFVAYGEWSEEASLGPSTPDG